jgi:uncharacterized membrane protein YccF (DUF307 family)
MPTLSASDYTSFIKAQAASQAYRNGAVPIPIQTRAQPFLNQSVLNAQLLTSQAAYVLTPPKIIVDTVLTTVSAASAATLTGAASTDTGTTVTYTSSVAHGLTAGMVVTISGFTTTPAFNLANQTVLASGLTATQFKVTNTASGTAETTSTTGRINGYVYYTTAAAHNLSTATQNLSITGLSTATFNLTLVNVALAPSSTVFAIASSATGTAVTSASGVLTLTRFPNVTSTITGITRVRPYDGVGRVNNPKSLVTLSQSGTLSSSKTQQAGGLPTTAPKGSGVYAPTPQLARVDTKATGAYKAVRQPV